MLKCIRIKKNFYDHFPSQYVLNANASKINIKIFTKLFQYNLSSLLQLLVILVILLGFWGQGCQSFPSQKHKRTSNQNQCLIVKNAWKGIISPLTHPQYKQTSGQEEEKGGTKEGHKAGHGKSVKRSQASCHQP